MTCCISRQMVPPAIHAVNNGVCSNLVAYQLVRSYNIDLTRQEASVHVSKAFHGAVPEV